MSDQDDSFEDLFAQAMQQVQRIEKSDKINPVSTPIKKNTQTIVRHISESNAFIPSPSTASKLQESDSPWILRANGVDKDALKKLANGQPRPYLNIDLHGMTRDKAIQTLEKEVQSTLQAGERVLAVIHGRGLHSQDGRAVLKHSVYQWLKSGAMSNHILAVVPNPDSAGGACLILLRRDKRN